MCKVKEQVVVFTFIFSWMVACRLPIDIFFNCETKNPETKNKNSLSINFLLFESSIA